MSYRRYSSSQLRWYLGGYGVIVTRIRKDLRNAYTDDGILRNHWKEEVKAYPRLLWRLGHNLYLSGNVQESIDVLERLCVLFGEAQGGNSHHGMSDNNGHESSAINGGVANASATSIDPATTNATTTSKVTATTTTTTTNHKKKAQHKEISQTPSALGQPVDASKSEIQGMDEMKASMYRVHQTIAQGYLTLFLNTKERSHLERCSLHYQSAVDHLQANLMAMFHLPSLLMEYARVLEYSGSFQAAMDVYSQILTKFPNFQGYFDAFYRTAVVGIHLASLAKTEEEKRETYDKCIDILQFLLEAVPSSIDSIHIIALYLRVLEASHDAGTRFRANNVVGPLFTACKSASIPGTEDVKDVKIWSAKHESWYLLGRYIESFHEYIVADQVYKKYLEILKRSTRGGKDLSYFLDVQKCLILARHFADVYNFTEAIRYAEIGLQIDRYNAEIRQWLVDHNVQYQNSISHETEAINRIKNIWKGRVWQIGFVDRLRRNMVKDNMARLASNYYDLEAREKLAYYAKRQFRPVFFHEEQCVVAIQRWYRVMRRERIWTDAQRQHYGNRANELLQKLVKQYYSPELRDDIILLAQHKFIPKKHPILACANRLKSENHAFNILFRALRVFSFKRKVSFRIAERRRAEQMRYLHSVILVQTIMRKYVAKMRYRHFLVTFHKEIEAATRIQRYYRKKKLSWKFVVFRLLYVEYKRRSRAMKLLKKKLPALLQAFRKRRQLGFKELERQKQRRNERYYRMDCHVSIWLVIWVHLYFDVQFYRLRRMESGTLKVTAAVRIQRFYAACQFRWKLSQAVKKLRLRQGVEYCPYYRGKLESYLKHQETFCYRNPGIDRHSAKFQSLLSQESVICDETMDAFDFMMLGLVLRHPQCGIRTIIMNNVTLFKDEVHFVLPERDPIAKRLDDSSKTTRRQSNTREDGGQSASLRDRIQGIEAGTATRFKAPLSPADQSKVSFFEGLTKCLSIKSIFIIGGKFHRQSLENVFKIVQLDNARIQEILIQDVNQFNFDEIAKQFLRSVYDESSRSLKPDSRTSMMSINQKENNRQEEAPSPGTAAILCQSAKLLLLDYFNYSIPGIEKICLHHCKLSDENVTLLAEALEVNSSLQKLHLSVNLITDKGFTSLFGAILKNKNSRLHLLDLSFNLIQCQQEEMLTLLASYRMEMHRNLELNKWILTLDFSHNQIVKGFDVIDHAVDTHMFPQLSIIYSPNNEHQQANITDLSKEEKSSSSSSVSTSKGEQKKTSSLPPLRIGSHERKLLKKKQSKRISRSVEKYQTTSDHSWLLPSRSFSDR